MEKEDLETVSAKKFQEVLPQRGAKKLVEEVEGRKD